ncbi:MAG: Rieske (2Fe-2S) protein [Candidatus Calescibacterium sp.]|nr:Rieske (2Fe-2S) protein [Candidatus Calescibacterium sp.]MCX7758114.1 Rieske (2Fe-2S) protein [bacterium]
MTNNQWIEAGIIENFKENNKKVIRVNDELEVMVIKIKDSFFAIENKCSHDEKPLSDGKIIDGEIIECKYHGARFNLQNGKALKMPAVTPINIFKTKIENDKIYILIE